MIPSLETYVDFLETRILIVDSTAAFGTVVEQSKPAPRPFNFHRRDARGDKEKLKVFYTLKADYKCLICKRNHLSNRCDELSRIPIHERRTKVHSCGACINCL